MIFLSLIADSIFVAILFSLQFGKVPPNEEWSNNITLITEIAVGVIVALMVLMIAKVNELKIEEKITTVLDIIKEQKKIESEMYSKGM